MNGHGPPRSPPRNQRSNRANANTSSNPRQEQWLRIRADSVGSVRGAFGAVPTNTTTNGTANNPAENNPSSRKAAHNQRLQRPEAPPGGPEGNVPAGRTAAEPKAEAQQRLHYAVLVGRQSRRRRQ